MTFKVGYIFSLAVPLLFVVSTRVLYTVANSRDSAVYAALIVEIH